MVCDARDYTLASFAGTKLVYGDTDSIFVNFTDHIKQQNPGREFTEYELLVESIQMGVRAAKNINSHMKAPQNIEYEKTLWPFTIFSKKRQKKAKKLCQRTFVWCARKEMDAV